MAEVCRICLRNECQHEETEKTLKDLFDSLLISLDLAESQISIVCKECVAQIHESFDFKTMCLHTEDTLLPFIEENASKMAQLDLRLVYSEIKSRQFSESKETADICRLCLEITTQWVSLETAISQTSVRDVFENNLPEISLQAIENPCICENCLKMLNNFYNFALKCKSRADLIKMNGSVENLQVENLIDENKIKVEIQLDNQVEDQVQKLFANEVENQFDKECKIEMNENSIDYVEHDVKRSVQSTPNSDRYMKEEENNDLYPAIIESKCQDRLGIQQPLENSKKLIPCDSCLNFYYNHVDLALHSINHSENGMYSCHICNNYANAERNHMVMHIRAHEAQGIEVNCDSGSDVDTSSIKEHCEETIKSKETKKLSIRTRPECQAFGTEPMMIEHNKQEHGQKTCTPIEKRPHICSHCGKGFSRKDTLTGHLRTHTGDKPHICAHCGDKFTGKSNLNYNLLTHKKEKPHICSHCAKGFSLKSHLNDHLHTHTGEKPHICSVCGKGFSQNTSLKRHSLIHTGEKSHICSQCGRGFCGKTNLKIHLRTHTGEKPHICSHCGKGFSQTRSMKRHLLTHTGEKPHICSLCEKRFSQKINLKRHLRTHTGEKPAHCGIEFSG